MGAYLISYTSYFIVKGCPSHLFEATFCFARGGDEDFGLAFTLWGVGYPCTWNSIGSSDG
jgi:hypothetical protein